MRRLIGLIVVVGILLIGVSTVLVADSQYDANVVSERNPFAPERPATLNSTTAAAYLINYEQTRFRNDLLGSREYTLDKHDIVRAECTAIATNRTGADRFRVRLQCNGGIDDTNRLFEPSEFAYTVTYRITEDVEEQLAVQDYPFASRDELRPRPSSAQ